MTVGNLFPNALAILGSDLKPNHPWFGESAERRCRFEALAGEFLEHVQSERLLRRFRDKFRNQLKILSARSKRGLIFFTADSTHILDVLYGCAYVKIDVDTLEERSYDRHADGFFGSTKRIHAVAILQRHLSGLEPTWTVFPTNNPTVLNRFTLAELRRIGGLHPKLQNLAFLENAVKLS